MQCILPDTFVIYFQLSGRRERSKVFCSTDSTILNILFTWCEPFIFKKWVGILRHLTVSGVNTMSEMYLACSFSITAG